MIEPLRHTSKFTRRDFWLIASLTIVYAVIAFYHLGSLHAPETHWKSAVKGESFYVDFGEVKQIERVNSFAAVGDGTFTITFSQDADAWEQGGQIEREYGDVFAWMSLDLNVAARYARVTVDKPGTHLKELAFFEQGSEVPLPVKDIIPEHVSPLSEGDIAYLFDEPDQTAYQNSYMNSTYFDEIYYVRTAYEHLHRLEPYEWTHPPLGKIIILLGTSIFGMNPFGWRIMGTLFGIAMIPLIYLFARRLFHRTGIAFFAAFLFAFDFMHFVQTRIATIDVYVVFFIILMFYFMYQYYTMNFYDHGLKKTLVPLAWCGICFGLGVASKWIALYAGAGLAVIFLLMMMKRYLEYRRAGKALRHVVQDGPTDGTISADGALPSDRAMPSDRTISAARAEQMRKVFAGHAMRTIAWCMLFFILVPGLIYVMSYIPYMTVHGADHGLADVVSVQKRMYNYHAHLTATHSFSSNWAEWPIMKRPIWYFGGEGLPEGLTSRIVAFGNPAVWWAGIAGVLAALVMAVVKRDRLIMFILIALGSVYLPWILITRSTFIYHFFATVPFMILAMSYLVSLLKDPFSLSRMRWVKIGVYTYMAAVLVLFAFFYPVLSGAVIDRSYSLTFLKWFDLWPL